MKTLTKLADWLVTFKGAAFSKFLWRMENLLILLYPICIICSSFTFCYFWYLYFLPLDFAGLPLKSCFVNQARVPARGPEDWRQHQIHPRDHDHLAAERCRLPEMAAHRGIENRPGEMTAIEEKKCSETDRNTKFSLTWVRCQIISHSSTVFSNIFWIRISIMLRISMLIRIQAPSKQTTMVPVTIEN